MAKTVQTDVTEGCEEEKMTDCTVAGLYLPQDGQLSLPSYIKK